MVLLHCHVFLPLGISHLCILLRSDPEPNTANYARVRYLHTRNGPDEPVLSDLAMSNFGFPETTGHSDNADVDLIRVTTSKLSTIECFSTLFHMPVTATLRGSKGKLVLSQNPHYITVDPAMQTVSTSQAELRKKVSEKVNSMRRDLLIPTLSFDQSCVPSTALVFSHTQMIELLEAVHVDVITIQMFGMKASLSWGKDMIYKIRKHDPKARVEVDFAVTIPAECLHWRWSPSSKRKNCLSIDSDTGRPSEPYVALSRAFDPEKVKRTSISGDCTRAQTLPIHLLAQAEFFSMGSATEHGNANDPGFYGTVRYDFSQGVVESLLSSGDPSEDGDDEETESEHRNDSEVEDTKSDDGRSSENDRGSEVALRAIAEKIKVYSIHYHTFANLCRVNVHTLDKVAKSKRYITNLEKWAKFLIENKNAQYGLRVETTAVIPIDFKPGSPVFEACPAMSPSIFFEDFFRTTQSILGVVEYAPIPAAFVGENMLRVISFARSSHVPMELRPFYGNEKKAVSLPAKKFALLVYMCCGVGTDSACKIVARGFRSGPKNSLLWLFTEMWRHLLQTNVRLLRDNQYINSPVHSLTMSGDQTSAEIYTCMVDPLIPTGENAVEVSLFGCSKFLVALDDLDVDEAADGRFQYRSLKDFHRSCLLAKEPLVQHDLITDMSFDDDLLPEDRVIHSKSHRDAYRFLTSVRVSPCTSAASDEVVSVRVQYKASGGVAASDQTRFSLLQKVWYRIIGEGTEIQRSKLEPWDRKLALLPEDERVEWWNEGEVTGLDQFFFTCGRTEDALHFFRCVKIFEESSGSGETRHTIKFAGGNQRAASSNRGEAHVMSLVWRRICGVYGRKWQLRYLANRQGTMMLGWQSVLELNPVPRDDDQWPPAEYIIESPSGKEREFVLTTAHGTSRVEEPVDDHMTDLLQP